jgi:hypothetical protein
MQQSGLGQDQVSQIRGYADQKLHRRITLIIQYIRYIRYIVKDDDDSDTPSTSTAPAPAAESTSQPEGQIK